LPLQFDRIEQRSLSAEIVQQVRHAIIYGEIGLGEHISEHGISKQMEVSRMPLREALMLLTKEGIVEHLQGRGFYVISFSPQDIYEIFSMRSLLECMALTRSIPCLEAEDFKELENLIEQQAKVISTGQYDLLTKLDMEFHEYFFEKANHTRLLKTWHNFEIQCQMLINRRFRKFSNDTPITVIEDHERLLDAAHRQDVTAALEITRSISNRVAQECIRMAKVYSGEGGEVSSKLKKQNKASLQV
jgi:DNA-binding GntR family transcriptional regulator